MRLDLCDLGFLGWQKKITTKYNLRENKKINLREHKIHGSHRRDIPSTYILIEFVSVTVGLICLGLICFIVGVLC